MLKLQEPYSADTQQSIHYTNLYIPLLDWKITLKPNEK